jgi:uncharacterized protein YbaR (Trm112 family)
MGEISLTKIFEHPVVIGFKTTKELCPYCQVKLKVHHTDIRKIYTLDIGEIEARRTFMYCADCGRVYPAEEFEKIVPPHSNVGYDVMILAGRLIFCEHHTLGEAVSELEKRHIPISTSEVAYLAQKFIIYLSILHGQAGEMLKIRILQNGGYILHIDGTCEGASPHLVTAIDEVTHFVLANVKVPSEKAEQITPFLKSMKEQYGNPLAVTSDMGRAFLSSVSEVFPGIPHYICHFHFLRDIGKDLLEKEYAIIRNKLKKYGITTQLRRRLHYYFENKTGDIHVDQLNELVTTPNQTNVKDSLLLKQVCHLLLLWALDGKNHGDGFGFPFDRPHAAFYKRLCLLSERLNSFHKQGIANKTISKIMTKITGDLTPLISDTQCREAFQILSEKEAVFDKLRSALAIALPDTTNGLNDHGEDIETQTIETRVRKFKEDLLKDECYHKNPDYQKLINQLDKYWEKLFSDPIKISVNGKDSFIQPQRTNNILEQFFRTIRRAHRRTTGNNSMCKKLQTMFADTPLVKNLENPEYMEIMLSGEKSLEEKFAQVDYKEVMEKMQKAGNVESKIPRKIKLFFRQEETMSKLLNLIPN